MCTNSSTDAATIQNAIGSSSPGDAVVIKGPCLLNAPVALADNRTYRGDSRGGTVITQAPNANLSAMFATDTWVNNQTWANAGIQIQDLTLDGNRANEASTATTVPLVVRGWDSRVQSVEIQNASGDGILIPNASANGTLLGTHNTMVNSMLTDVFVHDVNGIGIHNTDPANSVTDWMLGSGWVANTGGSAVSLDNAAGWQVHNLHIYGVGGNAIDANRCYNTNIANNYVEDFGDAGASGTTYYGIHCTVQGDVVSSVISANTVNWLNGSLPAAGTYVYIGAQGNTSGTGRVTVTGNGVVGENTSRETGLSYQLGGNTSMNVVSTGNIVNNVGTVRSAGTGVSVSAGS